MVNDDLTASSEKLLAFGLRTRMEGWGIEPEVSKQVATQLVEVFSISEEVLPEVGRDSDRHALAARVGWAIRDDDLRLIEAIAQGLVAAASAGFFVDSHTSLSGPITGLFLSLAQLVRRTRKKGARIDPNQARLLSILKSSRKPLSAEEIATSLSTKAPDAALSATECEAVLKTLCTVLLNDGTEVAFTACNAEGRWRTVGL